MKAACHMSPLGPKAVSLAQPRQAVSMGGTGYAGSVPTGVGQTHAHPAPPQAQARRAGPPPTRGLIPGSPMFPQGQKRLKPLTGQTH